MENQLTIRCLGCNEVTVTTDKALCFRCSQCNKKMFVQWGHNLRAGRSQVRDSDRGGPFSGNRAKCIWGIKEGGARRRVGDLQETMTTNRHASCSPRGAAVGGGRKRALICGVSYNNQKYKLRGTLNDAHQMRKFLVDTWGFPHAHIRMLTEEDGGRVPTKKSMEEGLRWLVEGCKAGDSLVFYFSGHGINQRELIPRDESDGLDESLCPLDFSTEGVIRDNHLNAILVRPLPPGVTLHAIVDACHSGTILDLPWIFNTKQNEWVDNSPPSGVYKGTMGGLAISFSACRDDQMAADTSAFTKKGMNGALTMSFIQALNNNANLTYRDLLSTMQDAIAKSRGSHFRIRLDKFFRRYFVQDPLLSSSRKFDINTRFQL